jgi:probable F420-dependent oxidoreductase
MQIGVIYPQLELPTDPDTVRVFVRQVEELGYRHFEIYDHVLGADPEVHVGWAGPYDVHSTFHEPLVFYGFLAGICKLELVTAIIASPQRQTALLAKQAAEVDILANGRFRLGVGVGYNTIEYEGMGQAFSTRGRRQEEQIGLLRRLWTEQSVIHHGTFDRIVGAGLAPSPVQRPIPIWLGGVSQTAYRRIGHLADGWFPRVSLGPELDEALATIRAAAAEVGRDTAGLGMGARIEIGESGRIDEAIQGFEGWRDAGATHVSVNTMGVGLTDVDGHLDALGKVAAALQLERSV